MDDRARQADPHRRGGRLVRLRQARHAARDQRDPAPQGRGPAARSFPGVTIHDPVYIEDGVTIERSEIGPNVSLEQGTTVSGQPASRTPSWAATRGSRGVRLDGAMLGNGVVAEGLAGSASLGDHSELTAAAVEPDASSPCRIDELCRSYLDLKYHFDPAAGERGRAGVARRPAGPVRRGRGAGAPGGAPVGGRRGGGARVGRPAGGDRPHRAAGRDPEQRSSGWSTSSPTSGTRSSGSTICSRVSTPCWPGPARRPAAARPRRSSGSARSPAFLDAARATLDEPPSVFVDTALAMLGGGGELIVQLAAALGAEAPGLPDELQTRRRAQALEALKRLRHRAPRRDRAQPPIRTPSPSARSSSRRRLHFEHARRVRRARALALRAPPPGGDHARSSRRWPRELSPRPWRELVDELRNDAPGDRRAPGRVPRGARPGARVSWRSGIWSRFRTRRWTWSPRRPSSRRWCRSRPTSRRRSISARQRGRFYVTPPDPSLPAEAAAQQRRGPLPPRASRRWWRTRRIRGTTSSSSPRRGSRSEVRRHLWTPVMVEGWALYCEQLAGRGGLLPDARGSASSSW